MEILDILYDLGLYGEKFFVEVFDTGCSIVCIPIPRSKENPKPIRCWLPFNSPTGIYDIFKMIQWRRAIRIKV